ncbi:MAG: hypothetical protein QHC90_31015 [Shinella sp.]|jgi:hypothetical protein|nr:hypothetical protein [Shinella sp.]
MSFQTESYSPGVYLPEEVDLLQSVVEEVCESTDLNHTAEERQRVAQYAMSMYDRGMTRKDSLVALCVAGVRHRQEPKATTSG